MIPVIETTMVKIEVYSKSYTFRVEVTKVRHKIYIFKNPEILTKLLLKNIFFKF